MREKIVRSLSKPVLVLASSFLACTAVGQEANVSNGSAQLSVEGAVHKLSIGAIPAASRVVSDRLEEPAPRALLELTVPDGALEEVSYPLGREFHLRMLISQPVAECTANNSSATNHEGEPVCADELRETEPSKADGGLVGTVHLTSFDPRPGGRIAFQVSVERFRFTNATGVVLDCCTSSVVTVDDRFDDQLRFGADQSAWLSSMSCSESTGPLQSAKCGP